MDFELFYYNITKEDVDNNNALQGLFQTIKKYDFKSKKMVHPDFQRLLVPFAWKKEYRTKTPVIIQLDLFHEKMKIGIEIEFFSGKIEKKLTYFEYLYKLNAINIGIIVSFYYRNKKESTEPYKDFFLSRTIPIYQTLRFQIPLILCLLKRISKKIKLD